jgi:hypothetical protein
MPKICQILNFFEITSEACDGITYEPLAQTTGDTTVANEQGNAINPESTTEDTPIFQKVLKRVLYIVIILVVILA